jgi:predicted GNAT family acetyltransferase
MTTFNHIENDGKGRFIVNYNGQEAGYLKYELTENGSLLANGTLVYEEFRDKRLGIPLFNQLIEYASKNNLKIYPTCPFVVKMFDKKPELASLLDPTYPYPTTKR